MRLTIEEYSQQFKMSKEMINSKLKNKKLDYVIEDGVTYISIDEQKEEETSLEVDSTEEEKSSEKTTSISKSKPRTTVATVIALYQRENLQLREKITKLEAKIDSLVDDKEQMLRDERDKIEQLYSSKDSQLKEILELVSSKMMIEQKKLLDNPRETIVEIEPIDVKERKKSKLVELKSYLKTVELKSYQRKIIKKRFYETYLNDDRIIQKNGKLYLDFALYDYSDLLEY